MFEYFPDYYPWSLAVMSAMNRGGHISEVDEACRPLRDLPDKKGPAAQDAWLTSWARMAERVERLGQADEEAGHPLSAGRKYLRAGLYGLLAERMPSHHHPRRLAVYRRAIDSFARGMLCRGDDVELVEVPFGEHRLPAIFSRAPGGGRAPCLVHFDGLDLTKEIIYAAVAEEYRRRGVSLLIVDHPGVGAALRLLNLPAVPEAELWAGACVDYLETRDDVDAGRVGIAALSLGGYYAPRAAAFEKRLRCCVAWGAIYDYGAAVADRLGGTGEPSVPGFAEHLGWVLNTPTIEETRAVAARMTLEGVAEHITCPLLVVHGENDRQIPLWHAERTVERAVNAPERELRIFRRADGGAEHCGADNGTLVVDCMADWVATKLGANPAGARPNGRKRT
ncbi:alpha/beta hydrolase family protein [Roseomonas sp. BN140053]|uniref:alpha/beta hydrolase family protein n=1 Tax=Roseomonas sp. BN140053 TaxID=3391898 RepID=UPI0039E7768E